MEKIEGLTADDAMNVLLEERRQRVQACTVDIQRVLRQHGCEIQARSVINDDGRIVTEVKIMAT